MCRIQMLFMAVMPFCATGIEVVPTFLLSKQQTQQLEVPVVTKFARTGGRRGVFSPIIDETTVTKQPTKTIISDSDESDCNATDYTGRTVLLDDDEQNDGTVRSETLLELIAEAETATAPPPTPPQSASLPVGVEATLLSCTSPGFQLYGTPVRVPKGTVPQFSAFRVIGSMGETVVEVKSRDIRTDVEGDESKASSTIVSNAMDTANRNGRLAKVLRRFAPVGAVRRAVNARPLTSLALNVSSTVLTRTGQHKVGGVTVTASRGGNRIGEPQRFEETVRVNAGDIVLRVTSAAGRLIEQNVHLDLAFDHFNAIGCTGTLPSLWDTDALWQSFRPAIPDASAAADGGIWG